MGMLSAMYSGVAGLNAHGRALSSVADNVANMSTTGFKASRANFGDIMVQSLSSGGGTSSQVGTGSRVLNMQVLMTQGSLETTGVSTDMAINGKGFFAVRRVSTVRAPAHQHLPDHLQRQRGWSLQHPRRPIPP